VRFSRAASAEQEHFDIFAQYRLGEVDSIGSETYDVAFTRGIGTQLNHA
jgi:hypothetical protein